MNVIIVTMNSRDTPIPPQETFIDSRRLNELRSLDNGSILFATDLVNDFMAHTEENFSLLDSAIAKGEIQTIWQVAHKLKSSSANIAAKQLVLTCIELESRSKANASIEELRATVDRFRAQV